MVLEWQQRTVCRKALVGPLLQQPLVVHCWPKRGTNPPPFNAMGGFTAMYNEVCQSLIPLIPSLPQNKHIISSSQRVPRGSKTSRFVCMAAARFTEKQSWSYENSVHSLDVGNTRNVIVTVHISHKDFVAYLVVSMIRDFHLLWSWLIFSASSLKVA